MKQSHATSCVINKPLEWHLRIVNVRCCELIFARPLPVQFSPFCCPHSGPFPSEERNDNCSIYCSFLFLLMKCLRSFSICSRRISSLCSSRSSLREMWLGNDVLADETSSRRFFAVVFCSSNCTKTSRLNSCWIRWETESLPTAIIDCTFLICTLMTSQRKSHCTHVGILNLAPRNFRQSARKYFHNMSGYGVRVFEWFQIRKLIASSLTHTRATW